jgi:hypothetical protein
MGFEAKTAGLTSKQVVNHIAAGRVAQNNLAKSGGAVTVPQFATSGPPAGPGPNEAIKGMAAGQLQSNAQGQYNSCIGQPASACTGKTGGRRTRKRRRRRRTRSRKQKVKH